MAHQYHAGSHCHAGGGGTAVPIGTGDVFKLVPATGETAATTLLCKVATGGVDQTMIIEPVGNGTSFGLARNPLSFVLQAPLDVESTNTSYPRLLVGSFFDLDGREIVFEQSTTNKDINQHRLEPGNTAKTLYQLAVEKNSNFPLLADCWEFRGILYGGPLLLTPGSPHSNPVTAVDSAYLPVSGAPMLYPGPVILGGSADLTMQGSTNPGFTDPGVGRVSVSGLSTNEVSAAQTIDLRGSVLGVVYIYWEQSGTDKRIRVTAKRKSKTLAHGSISATEYISSILAADEIFTIPGVATSMFASLELEQGLYELTIQALGSAASGISWTVQRLH